MNQCSNKLNNRKSLMILLTSIVAAIVLGFISHSATFAQTASQDVIDIGDRVAPTRIIAITRIPVTPVPTQFEVFAGSVTDQNGKPTAAQVTINGQVAKTGGEGFFKVRVPRTKDSRYVINVEKIGYVSISQIHVGAGVLDLNLQLQQAQRFEINPEEGVKVTDDRGTQIVIEPGSLVDAKGRPAEGPLTLLMYTYDLTSEEMVGDMSGINLEGELVSMESAGAFFAEFIDKAGNRYNLAPDAFAEVSIPLEQSPDSERLSAAEGLVLWSYDTESGLWIAEELTEQQNGRHVGRVSHFSTWNFDWEKREPACIRLTVDPNYLAANSPIQVKAVLQTSPVRVRFLNITMVNNVLHNLPASTDVHFFTPPPYTAAPFAIVNTGAPWGGTGVPPSPYDVCNGTLDIDGRGKIRGTKFHDLNGNGVQDAGEPGLPGWTIEVHDAAGNLVASIVTGVNGHYELELPLGSYTVSEVLLSDWSQTFPGSGSHGVTIAFNTVLDNIDFGNQYTPEPCGPIDIVFVIDDTGSMGNAINNIQNELSGIIASAIGISGGDYKMGLVTFKDNITVRNDLAAGNAASVLTNINSLVAGGGASGPEASDEALNTVINNLPVGTRPQNIDFNGTWRPTARKLIVLVTDATPGGFDDTFSAVDITNAEDRADDAAAADIEIAAIYVPKTWSASDAVPIMQNYATTTGGIYTETDADGSGTAAAIIEAIEECCEPDSQMYTAGEMDDFNPDADTPPASPSAGLLSFVPTISRAFDQGGSNRQFGHTFTNLIPDEGANTICHAKLEIRVRPERELMYNDTLGLFFVDSSGTRQDAWGRYFGSDNSSPGLFNYRWGTDNGKAPETIVLDLSALPMPDGSTRSFISQLNKYGFLDVYVQDDTSVDYVKLNIDYCCDGKICGSKFEDINGNGVWDDDEVGLADWTIQLHDGATVQTATTDSNGCYCFAPVEEGTYKVSEVNQNGWTQTHPASPDVHVVTVAQQSHIQNVDFGNQPENEPERKAIYVSSSTGGKVSGISFADEDILAFNPSTGGWAMYFDGSDVGLQKRDVNAFHVLDNGDILMSFNAPTKLGGTVYDDSDIAHFTGTTGTATSGTFSMYLDGSTVLLTTSGEGIDAIGFTADGDLVVSTLGTAKVGFTASDEDLIRLNTSNTWQRYFDGSDVQLKTWSEDVWATWIDGDTGEIHLSTQGNYKVASSSTTLSGDADDVFICQPVSLGSNTKCKFSSFWNGDSHGYGKESIDGYAVGPMPTGLVFKTLASRRAMIDDITEEIAEEDDTADDDVLDDDEVAVEIYLPLINQ